MDFSAAAQWVDEMTARSHLRTDWLEAIYARDPELGAQIEKLCYAVRAFLGAAETYGLVESGKRGMEAIAPFVTPVEAFDEVQRLKGASRLPAEIQPHEVEEYKRLQRFLNSAKAVQRIVSKRQGGA